MPNHNRCLPPSLHSPAWPPTNPASGTHTHCCEHINRYLLAVPSRTTLLLRVAVPENSGPLPGGRPAVNVTLFPTTRETTAAGGGGDDDDTPHGAPPPGRITLDPRCKPTSASALASSNGGVYMDSSAGAVTKTVEVEAGEYVAVVSSFSPQEADFVVTIYSTPALARVQRMMV